MNNNLLEKHLFKEIYVGIKLYETPNRKWGVR